MLFIRNINFFYVSNVFYVYKGGYMAEQSYLFDFARVDNFIENINVAFFFEEMWTVIGIDSSGNKTYPTGQSVEDSFELLFVEYGGDNISDYLDSDGLLDTTKVTGVHIEDCGLDWYNQGEGEATFEIHDDVTFDIGEVNIPIKAVFLRNKSTQYIMGYSINMSPFTVTNEVVFDDDVIFWDVSRFKE